MISVIVPVYNVEKYLDKCIQSIVNQTYRDLEIILIDDGSQDNSGAICDEWAKKDRRIIVKHQKNAGQSNARNLGLKIAKGNYIGFVDSDDYIEQDMFEALLKTIEKYDADISICGHITVFENGRAKENSNENFEKELSYDDLWNVIFCQLNNSTWNKLYKSELLQNQRFDTAIFHGEDFLFNLEYLVKCHKGAVNNSPKYNYLQRNNSVTSSGFSEKKIKEIESKDLARLFVIKNYPSLLKTADLYCFRARMNVLRGVYKSGKKSEYCDLVKECNDYVKSNFKHNFDLLKKKEKVEYILFSHFRFIYSLMLKLM